MVVVGKSTVLASTYNVFYTPLNTITDLSGDSMTWTGAFPDGDIQSKSDYPIGVIDTPDIPDQIDLTLDYSVADTEIIVTVTVYSTKAEEAAKVADKVIDKIDTQKSSFEDSNLFFGNPLIVNTDSDFFMRGGIKIHFYMVQFSFRYIYDRS